LIPTPIWRAPEDKTSNQTERKTLPETREKVNKYNKYRRFSSLSVTAHRLYSQYSPAKAAREPAPLAHIVSSGVQRASRRFCHSGNILFVGPARTKQTPKETQGVQLIACADVLEFHSARAACESEILKTALLSVFFFRNKS
jgi:hypothetical protein